MSSTTVSASSSFSESSQSSQDSQLSTLSPSDPPQVEASQDTSTSSTGTRIRATRTPHSFVWQDSTTGVVHGTKVLHQGYEKWECTHCPNRTQPKRYLVSSGTRHPAMHLKRKHSIEEAYSNKRQRLERTTEGIQQAL